MNFGKSESNVFKIYQNEQKRIAYGQNNQRESYLLFRHQEK